jgi:hypothetical protein
MTDTYTPGPWHVEDDQTVWAGAELVAGAARLNMPMAANARLIAKAPEMRDLLMELFDAPGVTLRLKGNRDTVQEILARGLALVEEFRGQS